MPLISGPLKVIFWCSSWTALSPTPEIFVTNDILPPLEVFVITLRPSVPPLKFISLAPLVVPVKFNCPPTLKVFSIPTPPSTIKAPVSLSVESVVSVIINEPILVEPPT